MPEASVYSSAMQMNDAPALLRRIGGLLRAKQFLVFYAIALYALDLGAPVASFWLRDHHPLHTLLADSNSALGDAVLAPSAALVALAVVYLAATAWFTAGYYRSLLGRLHWNPRDGRQFARMLSLVVLTEVIGWGLGAAFAREGADNLGQLVLVAAVVADILLLYVGYAIVVSDVGLPHALVRSWRTLRANLAISVAMAVLPYVVGGFVYLLVPGGGGFADVLPPVVVVTALMGSVSFVSSVVLISVYIDAIEKRRVPHTS